MLRIKISLSTMFLLLSTGVMTAQTKKPDSVGYLNRKLKTEEINFVTGYYVQEGTNAAVTGGIGDEHLTDVATTFSIKLARYDKHKRKHTLTGEIGVDVYTSASSDKIDPSTVSSASKSDTRFYPSVNYAVENNAKQYSAGSSLSFSNEFDYTSYGASLHLTKWSKDHNRELTANSSVFLDRWKVILPVELRPSGYGSGSETDSRPVDHKPRNSYNWGLVYSQVVSKNFQVAFMADVAYQHGLLATKFQRVYFQDSSVKTENLPNSRIKFPLGVRANYFIGDNFVLRTWYRYYQDDWAVKAHTISMEISYKITPFFSIAPYYRFYTQQQVKYFARYGDHNPGELYYTSDYDLSKFSSNMFGLNLRFANLNDKFFIKKINTLDVRYGYYKRNTGFSSHSLTFALNFK